MTDVVDAPARRISIAQLARLEGISRQAAHKRVKALEAAGKITTVRAGASVLVDLDEFRAAVQQTADPSRALAMGRAISGVSKFADAKAARAAVELELKELELAERKGQLRAVADIEASAMEAGRAIVRRLEGLLQQAEEITSIAHKKGADGVRQHLKMLIHDLRARIADDLETITGCGDGGAAE